MIYYLKLSEIRSFKFVHQKHQQIDVNYLIIGWRYLHIDWTHPIGAVFQSICLAYLKRTKHMGSL